MKLEEAREYALSLPEVHEEPHFKLSSLSAEAAAEKTQYRRRNLQLKTRSDRSDIFVGRRLQRGIRLISSLNAPIEPEPREKLLFMGVKEP